MRLFFPGLLALLIAAPLHAQTGATLSGSVFCADTGAPARFALLGLLPIAKPQGNQFTRATPAQLLTSANPSSAAPGTVAIDGSYTIAGIPSGTYYVRVLLNGYLDPLNLFTEDELSNPSPEMQKLIDQSVPTITIAGNESLHLDLRLERSAAITGRILYDDGSPAQGWRITAKRKLSGAPTDSSGGYRYVSDEMGTLSLTDDRGTFRITGIPPGDYILNASYQSSFMQRVDGTIRGENFYLSIYNGGVFRAKDAKTITLVSGEERTGMDFSIPLNGLHNISGRVVVKSDSHAVNSGMISISTPDDPALRGTIPIHPDGTFIFRYLPGKSTYTLSANGSDSRPADPATPPLTLNGALSTVNTTVNGMQFRLAFQTHSYGNASTEVHLEDSNITGITIALPDAPAPPAKN